jgi:hypothetical protein
LYRDACSIAVSKGEHFHVTAGKSRHDLDHSGIDRAHTTSRVNYYRIVLTDTSTARGSASGTSRR